MIARSFLHTALAAGLGLALAGCGPDKPAQAEPAKTENPAAAVPPPGRPTRRSPRWGPYPSAPRNWRNGWPPCRSRSVTT